MKPEKRNVNLWLGVGILLVIYSMITSLRPDPGTTSYFVLYQQGMAKIFSGIVGIVGSIIILFNLARRWRKDRMKTDRAFCPGCGSVLRNLNDSFCHNCGSKLN